jgi:hypothetical protein
MEEVRAACEVRFTEELDSRDLHQHRTQGPGYRAFRNRVGIGQWYGGGQHYIMVSELGP